MRGGYFINSLLSVTSNKYKEKRDWLWVIEQCIIHRENKISFKEHDDISDVIDDFRNNGYSDLSGHQRFYYENPHHLAIEFGIDAVLILKEYVYGIRNKQKPASIDVYLGTCVFSDHFNLTDIQLRRGEFKDHVSELKVDD